MGSVRLRLVFEDRHLLTKSQKSEGLKRCCILLKPELETISDLASHLTQSFNLHSTCPNGLRISMDGYVLPSFESTHIFMDKDIIKVKRKEGAGAEIVEVADEPISYEEPEIVEKLPLSNGVKLLALEEFEKETGGYKSEPEDIEYDSPVEIASKKRKSSKKLHSSKKKRIKSTSPENSSKPVKGVKDDGHLNDQSVCDKGLLSLKSLTKDRSTKTSAKLKKARTTDIGKGTEDNERIATKERHANLQENGEKDLADVPENTKKGPSRSARRKKAKRKWLKELLNSQKDELVQSIPDKSMTTSPEGKSPSSGRENNKVVATKFQEHQESEVKTDTEAALVPIVVRPGHIRFEPLDKDQVVQQTHNPEGNFQWNGITSKRKGQKWGMEKTSVSRSNDYEGSRDWNSNTSKWNGQKRGAEIAWNGTTTKNNGKDWGMEKTSVSRSNNYDDPMEESVETENLAWNDVPSKNNEQRWVTGNTSNPEIVGNKDFWDNSLQKRSIEGREHLDNPADFEKLHPFSRLPKEGDVIAYRLVELSSTWCPELSAYRVGKVSWFDSKSNKVMLMPVPGYPIVSDEKRDEEDEENVQEPDTSPYMEDGSLEIDFASLVDVRNFNKDNSEPVSNKGDLVSSKKTPVSNTNVPVSNKEATKSSSSKGAVSGVISNARTEERNDRVTENGGSGSSWEEISQVLRQKKTELSNEKEGWTQLESSDKPQRSYSYRALRGSALGPVMARLRAAEELI